MMQQVSAIGCFRYVLQVARGFQYTTGRHDQIMTAGMHVAGREPLVPLFAYGLLCRVLEDYEWFARFSPRAAAWGCAPLGTWGLMGGTLGAYIGACIITAALPAALGAIRAMQRSSEQTDPELARTYSVLESSQQKLLTVTRYACKLLVPLVMITAALSLITAQRSVWIGAGLGMAGLIAEYTVGKVPMLQRSARLAEWVRQIHRIMQILALVGIVATNVYVGSWIAAIPVILSLIDKLMHLLGVFYLLHKLETWLLGKVPQGDYRAPPLLAYSALPVVKRRDYLAPAPVVDQGSSSQGPVERPLPALAAPSMDGRRVRLGALVEVIADLRTAGGLCGGDIEVSNYLSWEIDSIKPEEYRLSRLAMEGAEHRIFNWLDRQTDRMVPQPEVEQPSASTVALPQGHELPIGRHQALFMRQRHERRAVLALQQQEQKQKVDKHRDLLRGAIRDVQRGSTLFAGRFVGPRAKEYLALILQYLDDLISAGHPEPEQARLEKALCFLAELQAEQDQGSCSSGLQKSFRSMCYAHGVVTAVQPAILHYLGELREQELLETLEDSVLTGPQASILGRGVHVTTLLGTAYPELNLPGERLSATDDDYACTPLRYVYTRWLVGKEGIEPLKQNARDHVDLIARVLRGYHSGILKPAIMAWKEAIRTNYGVDVDEKLPNEWQWARLLLLDTGVLKLTESGRLKLYSQQFPVNIPFLGENRRS